MQLSDCFKFRLFVLAIALVPTVVAWSQTEASSSAIPARLLNNLVQGRLYFANYFPIKGNPFFTKKWTFGDVHLLDTDYRNLPLWYDIYKDELILLQQQGQNLQFIRLNQDQVQYFRVEERRFINLEHSRYRDLDLGKGYYEVAFEDRISLLIKRVLEVLEEDETLASYFSRKDRWIMVADGQAYRIQNKKSFLAAAGKARQGQLSTFIKKQKIRFKRAGDAEWLQLITYLNSLQSDRI